MQRSAISWNVRLADRESDLERDEHGHWLAHPRSRPEHPFASGRNRLSIESEHHVERFQDANVRALAVRSHDAVQDDDALKTRAHRFGRVGRWRAAQGNRCLTPLPIGYTPPSPLPGPVLSPIRIRACRRSGWLRARVILEVATAAGAGAAGVGSGSGAIEGGSSTTIGSGGIGALTAGVGFGGAVSALVVLHHRHGGAVDPESRRASRDRAGSRSASSSRERATKNGESADDHRRMNGDRNRDCGREGGGERHLWSVWAE